MLRLKITLACATLLILTFYSQGSPLSLSSSSVWESAIRERREAAPASGDDCAKELNALNASCKADACPMDDKTLAKCCTCLQVCCSGESSSAEPEISSTEKLNKTITNAKSKITEAATKVEGFFKNVGENIKQGVGTAVDSVKSTANNAKDSAMKGINKAAEWVKNKTGSDGTTMTPCKGSERGTEAVSIAPTYLNGTILDANCTASSTDGGESTPEPTPEVTASEPTKKSKRSARGKQHDDSHSKEDHSDSSEESMTTTMNSNSNSNSYKDRESDDNRDGNSSSNFQSRTTTTTTKVPGMRKSKRSPANPREENSNDKDGKDPRDELMKKPTTESANTMTTMASKRSRRGAKMDMMSSTMDPNAKNCTEGHGHGSTTMASEGLEVPPTPKPKKPIGKKISDKDQGKIWITVTSNADSGSSSKLEIPNNGPEIPIRAPGSINPEEITLHTTYNFSSVGKTPGAYPTNENAVAAAGSLGAPLSNSEAESVPSAVGLVEKPGRCRSLKDGLRCVPLGKEAAQCKNDGGCSGTKKCCFYACHPNTDAGVCELPIFNE